MILSLSPSIVAVGILPSLTMTSSPGTSTVIACTYPSVLVKAPTIQNIKNFFISLAIATIDTKNINLLIPISFLKERNKEDKSIAFSYKHIDFYHPFKRKSACIYSQF